MSVEEKAKSMLKRYGFRDALIQAEQIILLIDLNDLKTKKYWDEVTELLSNPSFVLKTEKQL